LKLTLRKFATRLLLVTVVALYAYALGQQHQRDQLRTHCVPQTGQQLIAVQQSAAGLLCVYVQNYYGRARTYHRAK